MLDGRLEDARKDGWPCKYTAPGLNGDANDILVEELEIAHEGFIRI